jgi:hypothetical protein
MTNLECLDRLFERSIEKIRVGHRVDAKSLADQYHGWIAVPSVEALSGRDRGPVSPGSDVPVLPECGLQAFHIRALRHDWCTHSENRPGKAGA